MSNTGFIKFSDKATTFLNSIMTKVISPKKFINEALEAHNKYRKLHNVPPLEHDPNLSDLAADWAEHIAAHNVLQYRDGEYKNQQVGENILRSKAGYISGNIFFCI